LFSYYHHIYKIPINIYNISFKIIVQRLPVGLVPDAEPLESGACERLQRLSVGLIPDAEPLDLLQADGACERLHIDIAESFSNSTGSIS
jgi:hypothetical protein